MNKGFENQLEGQQEKHEQEQFSDLTIFTTTFYKKDDVSQVREKLAENFLKNAQDLGIKCVVVDGGSNEEFLKKVEGLNNVELVVDPSLKMGESRREALRVAMEKFNTPYFLWSEPEKDGLINSDSLEAMIEGLRKKQTDIVVPKRTTKDSMPEFQAWIESRANKRAGGLTSKESEKVKEILDLWFGPKMFNREGAEFFINYRGKLDKWDSIIKPVLDAYKAGKRIDPVEVKYTYDPSQTMAEENDKEMKRKRIDQYSAILAELGDKFWIDKLARKK
jgi:hypothetical protein